MLTFQRTMEAKLFEAIRSGDDSVALRLIESLEDVNVCQKGNASKTALRKAIKHGRLTIVKKLLEKGADANPKDRSYPAVNFPLSLACARRRVEMVKLLLAHGADPFLRTTGDNTGQMCPFEVALAVRNTDLIRVLLEHSTALHDRNRDLVIKGAIAAQEINKLKTYFELNSSLVGDSSVECTGRYLHEAVKLGNLRIVQMMLDSGAYIDNLVPGSMRFDPIVSMHVDGPIEQRADSTPLMQACRRRHVAIVEELLVRGADVNMTNSLGWTALQVTVAGVNRTPASAQERNLQIVRLLIRNGAFVNPGDKHRLDRNKNQLNKFSVESYLPGPLDRVIETICQFNLFSNQILLQIASNLIKAGARPLIPTMQLLMELHASDPEAKNPNVCELARLIIRSLDPFGSLFQSQTLLWTGATTNMADLIRDTLRQSLTLQSLCFLKLRDAVRPPLITNLNSDDIALPMLLKKNIIELD